MVDVKDATSNFLHDLGCLLLGDKSLDEEFSSNEGNGIRNRVQLQEDVDIQRELVEYALFLTCSVGNGLEFWEGDGNVVFTKVKCPGYHAEGGIRVQGHGVIVLSTGTSDNARDSKVVGRHGGVSVILGEAFDFGWFHTTFRSW